MNLLRPHIADGRGERRSLAPPIGGNAWRRRMRAEQGAAPDGAWTLRRVIVAAAILLPVLAVAGLAIPTMLMASWLPKWTVFIMAIPIGAAPPVALILLTRSMLAHTCRDACARAGICPACGYDLSDLPSEPDGCRVCPECGGAWRYGGGWRDREEGGAVGADAEG